MDEMVVMDRPDRQDPQEDMERLDPLDLKGHKVNFRIIFLVCCLNVLK